MPNCERCGEVSQEEWVLVPLNNAALDLLLYHPACHDAEEDDRIHNADDGPGSPQWAEECQEFGCHADGQADG